MIEPEDCRLKNKDKSIYYCSRSTCINHKECYALLTERRNKDIALNESLVGKSTAKVDLKIKQESPLLKLKLFI